jgi:hypothetical protein
MKEKENFIVFQGNTPRAFVGPFQVTIGPKVQNEQGRLFNLSSGSD